MVKNIISDKKKGQAAIEYLMTYGWAILIIAIVLVALYMLTQPQTTVRACEMEIGFTCNNPLPQIYYDKSIKKDNISIKLYNNKGRDINVSKVLCTTTQPAEVEVSHASLVDNTIRTGESVVFDTVCKKGANDLSIPARQQFAGYFIIWYNFDDDPNPSVKRMAYASIKEIILEK
ncbi:MAG: hypothetical protein AB1391_01480 [Candidatus Micrarchaeota archaeon]